MVKGIDKRTTYRIGDIIRTNAPSLATIVTVIVMMVMVVVVVVDSGGRVSAQTTTTLPRG
jgi:hypothetical protein